MLSNSNSSVEALDDVDYGLLLVFSEFRVHGQGQYLVGGAFGFGEVASLVAQCGQAGLQVERQRVVDLAADLAVGEVLAEGVAAGDSDHVLVEDVSSTRVGVGQDDAVLNRWRHGSGCSV